MSRVRLIAPLLLALAAPARAGEPAAGVLTRAPAVVAPATPEYPADAKARGVSGEVTLELDVSAEGEVLAARVVKPAGEGFDEAALAAARALRFSPAEIDGRPAAVTLEYRFRFDAPPPPPPAAAAAAVLRGVVLERGTREPLGGVAVAVGPESATFTDRDGRFELGGLPPGPVKVVASDPGHHRFETEERLEDGKAVEVTYYLRRAPRDAYEVVVVGERERKDVTTVTITAGEVGRVAGVSGDTVKIVQNLPGVARAPGGFGMLVVRGGNPTDTRTYVDGVEVPLVFHFGGLTSIVPSELVDAVDFEAGNFGVRYGRATGGRIDLRTRDPLAKRLHVVGDGNLFHALALVEGPVREGVTVALAARRSYADAMIAEAARRSDAFGVSVAPRYYDYQGKLTWRASPDDTVRLSVFGSDDRMSLTGLDTGSIQESDRFRIGTGFVQAAASWDHRFGEGARARLAVAHGFVDISNQYPFGAERDRFQLTSLRAEGSKDLGDRLSLAAGVDSRFLPTSSLQLEFPEIPPPNQLPDPDQRKIRARLRLQAMEAGLWLEATWRPLDGLVVVPGVRVEREVMINEMAWVDPRLSARYTPREGTTVKGAAGLYHQPPVPVYLTREWGNPALHEEGAWHFMTGLEQRLLGPLTLDLQLYYKRLFDLALPTDGPERYVNGGTGRSYGAELLLRWNPGGRFFGWVAYSRSRSERDQKVVGGAIMPSGDAFDQPHNLVALGTVDLPELWDGLSSGFRVRYATGNPYRRTVGAVYDADADRYQPVLDPSSTARMPDFFQLDLRVDKRWTWRTWILSAYVEVQNVTNRKNAEDVAYSYDYSQRGWMTGLPLFPSFGVRAEY